MRKSPFEIIYEDADLLIVNKPPGIPVIPPRDVKLPSLQKKLEVVFGKLFIVHRLDTDTSGIVCFAKNGIAHKHLNDQFEKHTVQKFYNAIVRGRMENKAGEIIFPITNHPSKSNVMIIHPKGKPSLTSYTVEEEFRHASLLRIEIKTGRTHQIRVHLAAINHPLLVDTVYGEAKGFYLSSVKKHYSKSIAHKTGEEEKPVITRLTLHARELGIKHPITHEEKIFTAHLPDDLLVVLKLLRKYDM